MSKAESILRPMNTNYISFSQALEMVQKYVSGSCPNLLESCSDQTKADLKQNIRRFIEIKHVNVEGKTVQILTDEIYTEMAELSFLTDYIFGSKSRTVEEININSWRDIEIQYTNGVCKKLQQGFSSPQNAIDVIRRMLRMSGEVIDNACPFAEGTLGQNIRIAVLKEPLVDEDVGVCASIRIVNSKKLGKDDFISRGTATEQMLYFLQTCLKFGTSMCISGGTGSGKTTLGGYLASTIPNNRRIFSIESGSREITLGKEEDGRIINSVVHTLARPSENEKQSINQDKLLELALRFHPDIIFIGEMRSGEAYTGQEAARTGHTVITTTHASSARTTWWRIVTLCKLKADMDEKTLVDLVTEAFPIVVFTKQLQDKQRRIMEIMECEILTDGTRSFHTLYQYKIIENRVDGGKVIIKGQHEKVNQISESLQRRLVDNGMPQDELRKILSDGDDAH